MITAQSFSSHEACYFTLVEATVVPVRAVLDLNVTFMAPFTVREAR